MALRAMVPCTGSLSKDVFILEYVYFTGDEFIVINDFSGDLMSRDTIEVRITETDRMMEVGIFSKHEHKIEVVIGEGVHSVKCELLPAINGMAYAGSVIGREVVYERSLEQVKADIEQENHDWRDSRRR